MSPLPRSGVGNYTRAWKAQGPGTLGNAPYRRTLTQEDIEIARRRRAEGWPWWRIADELDMERGRLSKLMREVTA